MNSLKGYKPLIINKGDLKHIEQFIELDSQNGNLVNKITKLLNEKNFNGVIYALKKDGKFKSVYVFEPDENESEPDVIKYTAGITLEDVPNEVIKEFEEIIADEFKEAVSVDETWRKVIWNDRAIEAKPIKLGSINLVTTIVVILISILIGALIGKILICSAIGVIIGIILRYYCR